MRGPAQIALIIALFLLGIYSSTYNPIYKQLEPAAEENEQKVNYLLKVVEKQDDTYRLADIFSGEVTTVVTSADLEVGDTISFRGQAQGDSIMIQDLHLHRHPMAAYYLSFVGLVLFASLFLREWKPDISNRTFFGRD